MVLREGQTVSPITCEEQLHNRELGSPFISNVLAMHESYLLTKFSSESICLKHNENKSRDLGRE